METQSLREEGKAHPAPHFISKHVLRKLCAELCAGAHTREIALTSRCHWQDVDAWAMKATASRLGGGDPPCPIRQGRVLE